MNDAIKRILINASHQEEVRVAITQGNRLEDIDIEYPNREQKKSNIYLATISRIEPSLEAVFVNYGAVRHGFLPIKEIEKSYFSKNPNHANSIKEVLREGQELLIQVEKEERGNKGAALTTYISLAGRYLVLMPNNPSAGGVSRRIEGEERMELKELLSSLNIPDNMSVIIRTAGLGKKISDLQWDLDILLHHWQSIKNAASQLQAPCLLHQESNVIIRAIRDNLKQNVKEIIIDNEKLYEQAKQYLDLLKSDNKDIIKYYSSDVPLFTRFQIESQIEEAFQHEVKLPSGGSVVFDRTEALTAIDINSAQSTKGHDIENTALHTNLEAAEEIARQLRIRDVGGLIVIDFIDMSNPRNQREVENKLRDALQDDRARIQLSKISKFGILEMSRQRLKSSLGDNTQVICSKCSGKGSVRTVESLSLSLLRIIEEECFKPETKEVQAQLPVELCTFLTNEKRINISKIEERSSTRVILIPNPHYTFPNYKINRIKNNDEIVAAKSYKIIELPEDVIYKSDSNTQNTGSEKAAVKDISRISSKKISPSKQNLLQRLWSSLFTSTTTEDSPKNKKTNKANRNNSSSNSKKPQRQQKSTRSSSRKQRNKTNKVSSSSDSQRHSNSSYGSDRQEQRENQRDNQRDNQRRNNQRRDNQKENQRDNQRQERHNKHKNHDEQKDYNYNRKSQHQTNQNKQPSTDNSAADVFYQKENITPEVATKGNNNVHNISNFENSDANKAQQQIKSDVADKNIATAENKAKTETKTKSKTEDKATTIAEIDFNQHKNNTQRNIDKTIIVPGAHAYKRRFYPKKKLPFEGNKYDVDCKDKKTENKPEDKIKEFEVQADLDVNNKDGL